MGQKQSRQHAKQDLGQSQAVAMSIKDNTGQGERSSGSAGTGMESSMRSSSHNNDEKNVFELKKLRRGCTGMFWRNDPRPGEPRLESNSDWPRDGAFLKGEVIHDAKGKQWLMATHVRQKNDKKWKPAPGGAAMPFEYNGHYYLDSV